MPTVEEEVYRIRLEAEGEAAIKRARDEVERLEKAASRAAQKFKDGTIDSARFGKAAEVLGSQIARARASLAAYESAARSSAGGRNLGHAALEAGRALEDLNYGLIGVMNNIPQLAMALGAGAGLTGVIGILGAAVLFLSRHWDGLMERLGMGASPVANATEEMEKLAEATRRTADEEARYQQLKRARDAGQSQAAALSPDQQAQEGAVRGELAGMQQAVVNGLVAAAPELLDSPEIRRLRAERRAGQEMFAEARDRPRGGVVGGALPDLAEIQGQLTRVEGELARAQSEAARDLLGLAQTDPGTLRRLSDAVRANPGAFPEGLGERLGEAARLGAGGLARPSAAEFGPSRQDMERLRGEWLAGRDRLRGGTGADFGPSRQDMERLRAEEHAEGLRAAREAEALERENRANAERYEAERERRAADLAGPLQSRFDAATIAGRIQDPDAVRAELGRSGLGAAEARDLAGPVLGALQRSLEERVRSKALAEGITPEEAEARMGRERALERRGAAIRRRQELLGDQLERARHNRPSQTFGDVASFAQAIQSAVGGVNYQQQAVDQLRKIATQNERLLRELREVNRF
jgi:hypothetical protein